MILFLFSKKNNKIRAAATGEHISWRLTRALHKSGREAKSCNMYVAFQRQSYIAVAISSPSALKGSARTTPKIKETKKKGKKKSMTRKKS